MIVKNDIALILEKAFKKSNIDEMPIVSNSNIVNIADFQCNSIFVYAKKNNLNPVNVAEEVVNKIESDERFEFSLSKPAFINVKLTDYGYNYYANAINKCEDMLITKAEEKKTILLDYGGANIAKELHMGHLRSPIIGEALKRVYTLLGHKCYSDVHLGDWGLQLGLTVAMLEEEGYIEICGDKYIKNKEITLDVLNDVYPKASAKKKVDVAFKEKADEITLRTQRKESPFYEIFEYIRNISVTKIKSNYEQLNCIFDYWYGESTCCDYVDRAVDIFVKKGLTQESDGALIVEVKKEGEHIPLEKKDPNDPNEVQRYKNPMPPVILKKHNGADVYATTDIATLLMRNQDLNLDEIVYIADKRQSIHFTQVFRACKMAGISSEKQELCFIGFGAMCGEDNKPFKTRSGDTIKLQEVIDMIKGKAKEKLKQNGIEDNDELALQIGVATLKFGDLINQASKDYVFDFDKFSSFEGKTGPYIQYTGARIQSILNKANVQDFEKEILVDNKEEKDLIKAILALNESYELCARDKSLNALCMAVYNVASAYATLYNNIKILSEPNEIRRNSLLALSNLTLKAIRLGFNTLAIDLPKKM